MANKARWWRDRTASCEDAISRALTAQLGLAETTLWINAHLRRGSGDRENLEVALDIIAFANNVTQDYLNMLRTERKEMNNVSNSRTAINTLRCPAADCQSDGNPAGNHKTKV